MESKSLGVLGRPVKPGDDKMNVGARANRWLGNDDIERARWIASL